MTGWTDCSFGTAVCELMQEQHYTYRDVGSWMGQAGGGDFHHVVHGTKSVSRDRVLRLIELVAPHLGVEPAFFVEYRLMVVMRRVRETPGMDERLYRKLAA